MLWKLVISFREKLCHFRYRKWKHTTSFDNWYHTALEPGQRKPRGTSVCLSTYFLVRDIFPAGFNVGMFCIFYFFILHQGAQRCRNHNHKILHLIKFENLWLVAVRQQWKTEKLTISIDPFARQTSTLGFISAQTLSELAPWQLLWSTSRIPKCVLNHCSFLGTALQIDLNLGINTIVWRQQFYRW